MLPGAAEAAQTRPAGLEGHRTDSGAFVAAAVVPVEVVEPASAVAAAVAEEDEPAVQPEGWWEERRFGPGWQQRPGVVSAQLGPASERWERPQEPQSSGR